MRVRAMSRPTCPMCLATCIFWVIYMWIIADHLLTAGHCGSRARCGIVADHLLAADRCGSLAFERILLKPILADSLRIVADQRILADSCLESTYVPYEGSRELSVCLVTCFSGSFTRGSLRIICLMRIVADHWPLSGSC